MTTESSGGATAAGNGPEVSSAAGDADTQKPSTPIREEYVESRAVPSREQTLVHEQSSPRPTSTARPVNVAVGADRHDGVRWGPVWAGLLTALTVFILLELLFYAFGWLTLVPGASDLTTARWVTTGVLALVGFFLGGLVAGATSMWKGLVSGLLHGFLVWALGVAAFIALTFFGGSALLGSFGSLAHELGVGPQVQTTGHLSNKDAHQLTNKAKDDAAPAFWGLLLPLGSSMVGGLLGAKIWPRRKDLEPETLQLRD